MTSWLCPKTGQPCKTQSMCAPYGGCATDAPMDKVVTWVGMFILTGLDMGIRPKQMLRALKPEKLEKIIDVLKESD